MLASLKTVPGRRPRKPRSSKAGGAAAAGRSGLCRGLRLGVGGELRVLGRPLQPREVPRDAGRGDVGVERRSQRRVRRGREALPHGPREHRLDRLAVVGPPG